MDNPLASLPPAQRKVLTYGVPVVVALVVLKRLTTPKAAPAPVVDAAATKPPSGFLPPASTDVLSLGQLSDFESSLTAAFARLTATNVTSDPSTPTPATPPPPVASPNPPPQAPPPQLSGPTLLASPGGWSVWQGDTGPIYGGISQTMVGIFQSYGYATRSITEADLVALEGRYGYAPGYPFPGTNA